MLNRQGTTTRTLLRQNAIAAQAQAPLPTAAAESDRANNEHIRALLKNFGLRTSLVRLKVLDTLLVASEEGQPLGVRGIHSQLLRVDVPLSFLSVREVLKRLCDEGVIVLGADKAYTLHPRALQWLDNDDSRPAR
ncbi:Fe2+/Zn2+ uptake regulation protein [Pseudomonas syringae]|nr:Fe2+/Zn2+ uptake regulation protein [Pseudomonas syringae]MBD8573957.1 Fe2+/Zn2+ uptake regulation protein [Pseudomonas syringae]MBD8791360.1 Fe2+/Zn2+ uptake regulation protein [Pseudomonas syringae]MBD8801506.1 Fe2+/Zn2+ uptake regulation protein [Pseudomonas syringae]MBD8810217.1 Fe2+/Zn2+ uptake regulation protein [Pseudomonas syringae]